MEKLNQINWKDIITEIVLPHLGTLTLYIVIFCVIGFILGVIYNIVLWQKNIFIRQHKYYNWLVKLYIPALLFTFLYFSVYFAFIFGAKSIIKDEESRIVNEIYETSVSQVFNSPQERKDFIVKLQKESAGIQKMSSDISKEVNTYVSQNNTGINLVDTSKNKLTNYIINKYQANLYSATLYGLIVASGSKIEVKDMTYNEVNTLVNALSTLEPKKIESSVKDKLTELVDKIITSQINGFAKSTLLLFILIILIPIIEYFIYKWWINKQNKPAV
jgi:hypothetical protein